MPGVIKVFVGTDLEGKMGGLPCGWLINNPDGSPMKEPPHPVLALGKVRHVGDQVAMVIAETLEQARKRSRGRGGGLRRRCSAVVDVRDAAKARALHEMSPNNHCYQWALGDKSQVDAAFAKAAHITQLDLVNNRLGAQRHGAAQRRSAATTAPPKSTSCMWPTRTRTSSAC